MNNVKIIIDGIEKDVYGLFYIYNSKYYFIYTEKEIDENNYVILYMTQVGKETQNTASGTISTGYMIGFEITDPEEQKSVQTSVSYIVADKKNNTVNPQIQYLPMSMLSNLKIASKKRFRLLKSIMVDNFGLSFDESSVSNNLEIENLEQTKTIDLPLENQNAEPTPLDDSFGLVVPIDPIKLLSGEDSKTEPIEIQDQTDKKENQEKDVVESQHLLEAITDGDKNTDTQLSQEEISAPALVPTDNNVIIDYRTKFFEEEDKNKELQEQIDQLTKKLEEIKKVLE